MEDEVSQTVVLIERLLTELSDDIRRQSNYVANERNQLNTLALAIKNGEFFGPSLASTAYNVSSVKPSNVTSSKTGLNRGRPLVIIRFNQPNVNYEQALYTAVNKVLQNQPNATFDLVAVSSVNGGTAKAALNANETRRNAQNVLRSLVAMGLPPGRGSLSAPSSSGGTGVGDGKYEVSATMVVLEKMSGLNKNSCAVLEISVTLGASPGCVCAGV